MSSDNSIVIKRIKANIQILKKQIHLLKENIQELTVDLQELCRDSEVAQEVLSALFASNPVHVEFFN